MMLDKKKIQDLVLDVMLLFIWDESSRGRKVAHFLLPSKVSTPGADFNTLVEDRHLAFALK